MFLMIIKWIIFILLGLMGLVLISLSVYKSYLKKSTKIKTSSGINSLLEIELGGWKQWIFIRGTERKNPILIFLHGGPGVSLPGISTSRLFDVELIKHFTVIHWDQRGTGKSYNKDIPADSMTFDQLVQDCKELIDYSCEKFNQEKVYLIGHSAGTIIGLRIAHMYPEKIQAYVGVGQIINDYERQKISYDFVVDKAIKYGDKKVHNRLIDIGPPPFSTLEKLYEKDSYIFKYGGVVRDKGYKRMGALVLSFLISPEYSLIEGIRSVRFKGREFTMNSMHEEIKRIELEKEIDSINVPIYFFEGEYDFATSAAPVEKFYENLAAPIGKEFIVFEESAHFMMIEEKEKYEQLLINLILNKSKN